MNSFLDKFFYKKRLKKIIRHIPRDLIVCDLGCGRDAYFLKNIINFIKKGIGFDAKIKNYKNAKIELKRFDIEKFLPLQKESCDVIIMMAVIEHLKYPQNILSECFRCLKNNGKLIITTPTPLAKPILEFLAFKLHLIDEAEISDHKQYFWPKDLKKELIKVGFKEKNIKYHFFEFLLNSLTIVHK